MLGSATRTPKSVCTTPKYKITTGIVCIDNRGNLLDADDPKPPCGFDVWRLVGTTATPVNSSIHPNGMGLIMTWTWRLIQEAEGDDD